MTELKFTLLDWGIILLYFGLLIYLTWQRDWQDDDEESFLLSGRKMSLAAFVATLVSTWYGGILGVGEYSYQNGLSTWLILGFPFYIFSALFAWLLAGKIRMNKALSLPEAVGNYYGEAAGRLSAIPIFILVSPAPYILMLGLIFQYLTGGAGHFLWYASAVALFSVAYVTFGGFSAVIHTDMLQIGLMFGGFTFLMIFAGMEFGGFGQLLDVIPANYSDISGGQDWQYILVWFFIALWTFVDPSFHQRAAAAKNPETARRGIFVSILLWSLFDFLTIFSGMYGWAILGPDLAEPIMVYPYLANEILPIGLKGLFFVALLATIMSTLDSYLFLSGQTLGRDLLVKIFPNIKNNTLTRISTLIAALIGIILIILLSQRYRPLVCHRLGDDSRPAYSRTRRVLALFYPAKKMGSTHYDWQYCYFTGLANPWYYQRGQRLYLPWHRTILPGTGNKRPVLAHWTPTRWRPSAGD
ncbi:MAG: sodium:solute symporter family protein [Fodinibius sp.]|nr:sodium:solute symporter family protein [Fodinibius sp.]